jgi:HTH-type transcriptional regulator, cell division transcriptional repressor
VRPKYDQATIVKGETMTDSDQDWYAPDIATFGDRLTAAREAAGMDQEALAKRIGIKKSTLRNWEDDLAEPRANRLSMLAGILNVSMMWLINGEGEGVGSPEAEPLSADMTEIILEIRAMKSDLHLKAEQLARLEKRLRTFVSTDV